MQILATHDRSYASNECYVYESIALCEEFDLYFVLWIQKVIGFSVIQDVRILCRPTSYPFLAIKKFRDFGGTYGDPKDDPISEDGVLEDEEL